MDSRMSARDLYERGRMLRQAKMYDRALADFRVALQDPYFAGKAHTQVALCFRAVGRHAEAVEALQRALDSSDLTSNEHLHVLYLLGQTLESLGRHAQALEAYGWVRQEEAGFLDVEDRIKQLCGMGSGTTGSFLTRKFRSIDLGRFCHDLRRHGLSLFAWASHTPISSSTALKRSTSLGASGRPAVIKRNPLVQRRYTRVGVRCRSQFAASTQMLAGEGELRDLSPGGCRLKSAITVPVGTTLVCWIFPVNGIEPLTIEGATVRWSHAQEFGVAFSQLSPQAERQIARLCASPSREST